MLKWWSMNKWAIKRWWKNHGEFLFTMIGTWVLIMGVLALEAKGII